jgi:hypothetical protein
MQESDSKASNSTIIVRETHSHDTTNPSQVHHQLIEIARRLDKQELQHRKLLQ